MKIEVGGKGTRVQADDKTTGDLTIKTNVPKLCYQNLKLSWNNSLALPTFVLSNIFMQKPFYFGQKVVYQPTKKELETLELLLAYRRSKSLFYLKQ